MQFLLNTVEIMNGVSDLFTEKWAEILGLISIPAIATALVCCLFKLITACISKKIATKNVRPLANKVDEATKVFNSTVSDIKTTFNESINDYSKLVEEKVAEGINKYQAEKRNAYNKILVENGKVEEVSEIGEVKIESIATEIGEKVAEVEQNVLDVAQNVSCETIEEDVIEKVEETKKIISGFSR